MFPAPFFRSFEPLENPLGFGAADWLELLLALALAVFAIALRSRLEPALRRFAAKTAWCAILLALLPIALRLALLPHHPVPAPDLYDEFGHLLVADTLLHFRLANPPHALPEFFETFFVLQEPTYSSIYPIGQGLALAIGRLILGLPWAGVLLSTAALCSLCYWMLRAWTTPLWALAGGLLAVFEFGPLNQWMNNYWGGAFSAAGGCLVFGALPRLSGPSPRRAAILLSCGLAINLLTRPYESIFLVVAVALFFLPSIRCPGELRRLAPLMSTTLLFVVPAVAVTLMQNKAVTGSWTTLPYTLSQYQYGVPASLTFQQNPTPHRSLTREQQLDYKMQVGFHGDGRDTLSSYLLRLEYRVRFYRFFFLPPLYLALPFFLLTLAGFRSLWIAASAALFALGINFFPAFQFHYLARATCLFVLISITGLRRMTRIGRTGREAALLILFLCGVHFTFWYAIHFFDESEISKNLRPYDSWTGINHTNPERRIDVNRQLDAIPGNLLVLVRYLPRHIFQDEWVYNRADIDGSRVVWARDLGPAENEKLLRYFPSRAVWLLEPDFRQPRLSPYQPTTPGS